MEVDTGICYKKSLQYWAEVPATLDGVLGGFGFISDADVEGSKLFLESLLSSKTTLKTNLVLDCGAGIGRITKYLLIPHFKEVDIVEPDEKFVNSIREYVGEEHIKIKNLYKKSLQEFQPNRKYDVIWCQWVLGYLTDEDLINFFDRCRRALAEGGVIIVKENVSSSGKLEKDEADSSVTRSLRQYINIFKASKLKRKKQCKQTNFPNGLYPVYMLALEQSS
ncbi:hypothetical protein O0L34_g1190 [Tuta absoluta]|nr:hypothetical protein O0L34_g1190 [Tuta absoluta]